MKNNIEQEISKGLIGWYQFHSEDRVCLVGQVSFAIVDLLQEMQGAGRVASFLWKKNIDELENAEEKFSLIIAMHDVLELGDPKENIKLLKSYLDLNGRLLLAANNRFGIRYFCGDRDPHTGRNFDGIENYRRFAVKKEDVLDGRMYDRAELEQMLVEAGFATRKFYSVFPTLENPSFIFAENYTPNEELNIRVFPMYNSPDTVFLEEEYLYTDLIKNGMFHTMANAYLIECYVEKQASCQDVLHVTMSLDRGHEDAMYTIIRGDSLVEDKTRPTVVEKKVAYIEGKKRLDELMQNADDLKSHGVKMIDAEVVDGIYRMPFVDAETALSYIRSKAQQNEKEFINAMDRFHQVVMNSSEIYRVIKDEKELQYFKKGYLDLVPLNCFVVDGEYVFYDQEFCVEDCPTGVIVARLVDLVYKGGFDLERILPREFFLKRYGIDKEISYYRRMAAEFLSNLRKEKELKVYYNHHRRNLETVNSNRQRMNYSEMEYQQKFVDIFKNLGERKLILFGSGNFTKRFIAMFGKDYEIDAIIDNSVTKWGELLEGFEIKSPEYLNEINREEYKVIICIKSFLSVAKQLETMGIIDYGIYDSAKSYPKSIQRMTRQNTEEKLEVSQKTDGHSKKKYHTGYVAGVFDMFHIGHVNLLRKAKEQCEYLIVGVVPDEDVIRTKNKKPIIPCEDRVAVIEACKYVDRVEALPAGFGGIRDAYKMYQFDVQFSGDDHGDNPDWIADKEYLNKHGADIVFFDYTEKTSSTKIREQLKDNGMI